MILCRLARRKDLSRKCRHLTSSWSLKFDFLRERSELSGAKELVLVGGVADQKKCTEEPYDAASR